MVISSAVFLILSANLLGLESGRFFLFLLSIYKLLQRPTDKAASFAMVNVHVHTGIIADSRRATNQYSPFNQRKIVEVKS